MNNKICVVIPTINQFPIVRKNIEILNQHNSFDDFSILVIDNGSDEEFHIDVPNVAVLRFEEPIGAYNVFRVALENTSADILAFIHSDLFITDRTWYRQVQGLFNGSKKLGIIGFIGSSEIDSLGGRGSRTCSNFQGKDYGEGLKGNRASIHGKEIPNQFRNAVVLDGCSMIFRRECLSSLPYIDNFPPMHFYDRVLSCQTLEAGWEIVVLGIACDHIGGRTMGEPKYEKLCKDWSRDNLGITEVSQWEEKNSEWFHDITNPNHDKPLNDWNSVIYNEAQKRFLKEWRDEKHFIPKSI